MCNGKTFIVLSACAVCLLLPSLASLPFFDPFRLYCFSVPAAWIVSVLTGGDFAVSAEAGIVTAGRVRFLVVPSCSGFAFYMILCASLVWILRSIDPRIFLFAYPAAVLVNAMRVFCAGMWSVFCAPAVSIIPRESQHMLVGVLIFVPFLLVFSLSAWYIYRKRKKESEDHVARE